MQLNDKGEVILETPHPSVTNWVKTGIYEHLMSQMDKVLTEETDDERVSA